MHHTRWILTEIALLHEEPYYEIPISRLLETRALNGSNVAAWPLQIAEKSWGDIEPFIDVFEAAVMSHRPNAKRDLNLELSFAEARKIAARVNRAT